MASAVRSREGYSGGPKGAGRAGATRCDDDDAAAFRISQSHLLASLPLSLSVWAPSSTCIEVYKYIYTLAHTHTQAHAHREGALSTRHHATLVHMIASTGLVFVSSFDLNVLKFKDRIAFGLFARNANANATARRRNFKL